MLILLFGLVKSQINQLQNDSFVKSYERTLKHKFAILAEKALKVVAQLFFFGGGDGLCNSLWMDLGQAQQQHPTMYSRRLGIGRVLGYVCWRINM